MMASCAKETRSPEDALRPEKGYSRVTLTVGGLTKGAVAEEEIRSVDVFVVDQEGVLESHVRKTRTGVVDGIYVLTGEKDFRVFVNYPEERMNAITTSAQLGAFAPRLSDSSDGALTMRGEAHETVNAEFFNMSVTVRRDAAKVVMGAAPVFKGHAEGSTLEGIYLNNVPKEWSEGCIVGADDAAKTWNHRNTLPSEISDPDVAALVSSSGTEAWKSPLYGFPNASPEAPDADTEDYVTKLVLATSLGGETLYYLVGIPGMKANTVYTISSLVLTVKGSTVPNVYNKQTFDIELEMEIWDDGDVNTHFNPAGYVLYASAPSVSRTWEGGSQDIVLTSYEELSDRKIPYEGGYKCYLSKDGGLTWTEKPQEGLSVSLKSSAPGETTYTVTIAKETPMFTVLGKEWPEDEQLNTYAGSPASPVDLSLTDNIRGDATDPSTQGRSTANCYVVKQPGTYMIPLVYGNAITSGKELPESYKTQNTAAYILPNLLNAYDEPIRSPYINHDIALLNHTATSASLVWEEEKDVVSVETQLRSYDGLQYLVFTVSPETIRPANALVALHDEAGRIVWSWHLWITCEDLRVKTGDGNILWAMLSHNLGQMPETTSSDYAKPLSYILRFVQQQGTKQYVDITVERFEYKENERTYPAASTIYQWGRKDPFPSVDTVYPAGAWYPGKVNNHTGHHQGYEIQRPTEIMTWSETVGTVANGTRLPCIFNLWSIGVTDASGAYSSTSKTVYDPCPAGFSVPRRYYLESIANLVQDGTLKYDTARHGYEYYAQNITFYIPSSRILDYSGRTYGFSALWANTRGSQCMPWVFSNSYFKEDSSYGHSACIRPVGQIR